jgi:hypothetical protein
VIASGHNDSASGRHTGAACQPRTIGARLGGGPRNEGFHLDGAKLERLMEPVPTENILPEPER